MSVDIIIPKPIPPGEKVQVGQGYQFPTCDRCLRESSDRNPVILSGPRPSEDFREALRGVTRRNALCVECRLYLKGDL
jgi:hypothetical protein